jgi:hypothetical protein
MQNHTPLIKEKQTVRSEQEDFLLVTTTFGTWEESSGWWGHLEISKQLKM